MGFSPSYQILEEYPEYSKGVYRSLVGYFSRNGDFDAVSWAAYRERISHRRLLLTNLGPISVIFESAMKSFFTKEQFSKPLLL